LRNFSAFDESFLAKKGWRILTNPNSLMKVIQENTSPTTPLLMLLLVLELDPTTFGEVSNIPLGC